LRHHSQASNHAPRQHRVGRRCHRSGHRRDQPRFEDRVDVAESFRSEFLFSVIVATICGQLRAPLAMRVRSTPLGQSGIESAWSKHNSNESAVPNNVDASQLSDVFKKSAEIVLGIARRDSFRHLAVLAKTRTRSKRIDCHASTRLARLRGSVDYVVAGDLCQLGDQGVIGPAPSAWSCPLSRGSSMVSNRVQSASASFSNAWCLA
jgi:hypothetical protein